MDFSNGMLTLDECDKKQIQKMSLNMFYENSRTLGKGNYGVVRKIVNKSTGITYAAKYIKKKKMNKDWLATIHNEIAILKKCKSQNIVELHEVFETRSHITLVFDFLAGGDLKTVFQKVNSFSEVDTKTIIRQVLESVRTLHKQNIVHMDIKLGNILLSKPNSFENMKLCDFGLSRWLEPGKVVKTTNGTLDYVAPEVLTGDPITTKSDIWSIGVLTYGLLSGDMPFTDETDKDTASNIKKGDVDFTLQAFNSVSAESINFIKAMLIVDPKMRASADELLQHAWFTS